MGQTRESYPDQLRRMAVDLTQVQHLFELGFAAEKLNNIADAIENLLGTTPETARNPTADPG